MEPMPHEAHNAAPMPAPEAAAPAHHSAHGDYSSSPIDTLKLGWKAFWQHSKQSFISVVAINTVLAFVGGLTLVIGVVAALFAILFSVINSGNSVVNEYYSLALAYVPADTADVLHNLSQATSALGIVAVIALAVALFVCSFLAANFVTYANMGVVQRQTVHIGQVMSAAFKRTLPLIGYFLIVLVAFVAVGILLSILLSSTPTAMLGIIAPLLLIVLAVAVIILSLRLAFTTFFVVAEKQGPFKAIKSSWQLSRKRTWEILGLLSLIAIAGLVLDIVFTALTAATRSAAGLSLSVSIVELVVNVALSLVTIGVFAQYYSQARAAASAGVMHKVNYGLNIGMFAVLIIASFISSSIQSSLMPTPTTSNGFDSSLYQDSTAPSSDSSLDDFYNNLYKDNTDTPTDTSPYLYQ